MGEETFTPCKSKRPTEHTPCDVKVACERILFRWGVGGTWGMLQRCIDWICDSKQAALSSYNQGISGGTLGTQLVADACRKQEMPLNQYTLAITGIWIHIIPQSHCETSWAYWTSRAQWRIWPLQVLHQSTAWRSPGQIETMFFRLLPQPHNISHCITTHHNSPQPSTNVIWLKND